MSEKKLNELNEMEAADGVFGERESKEGLLNDEEADSTVGGVGPLGVPSTTSAIPCYYTKPIKPTTR